MDYELAKELRDAGFEFHEAMEWHGGHAYRFDTNDKYMFKEPTLSELIEACGVGIEDFRLDRIFIGGTQGTYWRAAITFHGEVDVTTVADGTTTLEAVARLWLALNPNT